MYLMLVYIVNILVNIFLVGVFMLLMRTIGQRLGFERLIQSLLNLKMKK